MDVFGLPNDQVKRTGQAARTATDVHGSRNALKTENPPLGRVRLNRLLGIVLSLPSADVRPCNSFNEHSGVITYFLDDRSNGNH